MYLHALAKLATAEGFELPSLSRVRKYWNPTFKKYWNYWSNLLYMLFTKQQLIFQC